MSEEDRIRFEIVTGMLNEFPKLRESVEKWLIEKEKLKLKNKK